MVNVQFDRNVSMISSGEGPVVSQPEHGSYIFQLLAAIGALVGAVVFMFKALLSSKDQHLQSLVEHHSVQNNEHRETIGHLESKLDQCEQKHDESEKEMHDLWWTLAKKFETTPEKLRKAADDSDRVL